jgi:hypothetical protein
MLWNPARSPFSASNRFPGGTFSSSRVVTESIWTSLRTATRAIEFQRRLVPVSNSVRVSFFAKLLINPSPLYNDFRYTTSVMRGPSISSSSAGKPIAPA